MPPESDFSLPEPVPEPETVRGESAPDAAPRAASGGSPRVRPSRSGAASGRSQAGAGAATTGAVDPGDSVSAGEAGAADPLPADPDVADDAAEGPAEAPADSRAAQTVSGDAAQPELRARNSSAAGGRSAEPTASQHASAPERSARVEVPVPSVVRARERARLALQNPVVLRAEMLTKRYGSLIAANEISVDVHAGSFTGIVGPNGAGKTTTLSMISGLLRPTSGRVTVGGVDVWADGPAAKRLIGSLPDRLRLFDRLTGAQLLYYSGVLHGVDEASVAQRSAELSESFGLGSALGRLVSDYSAGMQKKIALACSMIHAPQLLVLDEPFETIDPVSASNVTEILEKYVASGGSVVMSSHSLDLIQRICDHVSVIVDGDVIAQGTVDAVRDGMSLEERFTQLTGSDDTRKGLEWLRGSSASE